MSVNMIDFFKQHQGKQVSALFEDTTYSLILDSVTTLDLPQQDGNTPHSAFSLTFLSDHEQYLGQGTYRLQFDDQIKEIFMVPIAPEQGKKAYQAIFN